ncbi:hypothetical protein [Streptomyces sp. SID13726]|uniref:hypothetical protein n=1 Tax=Streptomyces sp. SID13726 TaxID=2706058 RepID=UPI0013B7B3C4|nr:hypothetical protein [Streptomyces sp. SID13726]NEB00670.1 hypothetical protein [Streptomyces sp. SID13726]
MTTLRLDFHSTPLDLEVAPGAEIGDALAFLATHLTAEETKPDESDREPVATLRVHAYDPERLAPPAGAVQEDIYLRKSASEFFTVPARRALVDGLEYLECTKTGSRFVFDRAARVVDVTLGAGGHMDLVELVRDLVLKHQENTGAAVLHATAAYRDGEVVLVTGAKGAGKSTVLLELVEHFGYQVLSGDKTVLHELPDGSVVAAGWPDYPHLGYGTVAKYPGLKEIAGIGDDYEPAAGHAFSPVGKFAVDPLPFRDRFPSAPVGVRVPVAAILHPAIGPGADTVVEPLTGGREEHAQVLRANVESAFDGANSGWHHYLDDERAAQAARLTRITEVLAGVPAWTLTGPGDLTAANTPPLISGPAEVAR